MNTTIQAISAIAPANERTRLFAMVAERYPKFVRCQQSTRRHFPVINLTRVQVQHPMEVVSAQNVDTRQLKSNT